MDNSAQKIKIICRIQNGKWQEQLLLNDEETMDGMMLQAQQWLHLFAPERLTEQLVRQYGESSVLVFRTTMTQVQELLTLLEKHGGSDRL